MLLVVNHHAGNRNKTPDIDLFRQQQYTIFETTGQDDSRKLRALIARLHPPAIIVIGGDGTVHMVAQLIIGADIALAIIPRGSSNGIFKELGVKERPIDQREVRHIDVININDEYCLHLAGFGINAHIMSEFRHQKIRGVLGHILAFSKSIFRMGRKRYLVNGKEEKFRLLVLANGQNYGQGVTVNPKGKIDDSVFELCNLYTQEPMKEVTIINKEKQPFQIDGEFKGYPKRVKATIRPRALKLLV